MFKILGIGCLWRHLQNLRQSNMVSTKVIELVEYSDSWAVYSCQEVTNQSCIFAILDIFVAFVSYCMCLQPILQTISKCFCITKFIFVFSLHLSAKHHQFTVDGSKSLLSVTEAIILHCLDYLSYYLERLLRDLEMIKLGALTLEARQARAWQHGKQLVMQNPKTIESQFENQDCKSACEKIIEVFIFESAGLCCIPTCKRKKQY